MFKTMTLGQKLSSKQFDEIEEELRIRLFNLQRECEEHKLAVLVTLCGVDCSGRGKVMNLLAKWLDNKKVRNHTFWNTSDEEKARPNSWRYWVKLPAKGEFGLFFGGWYSEPIRKASYGEISESELYRMMGRHIERERTLAYNDYVLAKFWLHLSEEEHAKRRKERKKEKGSVHFTPYEEKSEKNYPALIETVSKVITMTDKHFSPWFVIDACDDEFRDVSIAQALIDTIQNALETKKNKQKEEIIQTPDSENRINVLDRVDLSKTLEKEEYRKKIKELQTEVYNLTYEAYKKGISSTLVFEGWDAAGKGGAIRRVSEAVDARITQVIPISAPTDEELAHHYLWRFWRHVPMAGHVTIYDRSWYGRVMVERVEGFSSQSVWKKAYSEINNFEEQLVENKNILLKFWVHISQEEQLRRFNEREEVSWKNYKITDEDWRNREKADAYKVAVEEMFLRTDTLEAPWHIIPAESKYFARVEVLTIFRDALLKALGKDKKALDDDIALKSVKEVKGKKK